MLIDLNELFACDDNHKEMQIEWEAKELQFSMGTYQLQDAKPVRLDLFHSSKRRIEVSGSTEFTLLLQCDRCLEDVRVPFAIEFHKEIDGKNLETEDDSDDTQYIVDSALDVGKIIRDEALLAWPAKVLCREDCKGICAVCGNNLNVSDCGCDRTVLDPRMAAIQDIFKNVNQ